ncbi:uncharacterized protein TNCV_470101 [Trichonephila clavipes]|nr:uncharacterized protein TNCV_470101 [Trichonephila clavipes]
MKRVSKISPTETPAERIKSACRRNHHFPPRPAEEGTLTGVRYRDEILDPYVCRYAGAIGNDFILMDNARPNRAVIVEEYLEGLSLERMK